LAILYLSSNDVEDINEGVFIGQVKTYMRAYCVENETEVYFPMELG
jgi:hypothetical protein